MDAEGIFASPRELQDSWPLAVCTAIYRWSINYVTEARCRALKYLNLKDNYQYAHSRLPVFIGTKTMSADAQIKTDDCNSLIVYLCILWFFYYYYYSSYFQCISVLLSFSLEKKSGQWYRLPCLGYCVNIGPYGAFGADHLYDGWWDFFLGYECTFGSRMLQDERNMWWYWSAFFWLNQI